MRIALTHAQRGAVAAALEAGDVVIEPTSEGHYTGPIVIEHTRSARFVLVARDGARTELRPNEVHPEVEVDREVGPLVISRRTRTAHVDDVELKLGRLEFGLLWTLAADPERVMARDQLLAEVWGITPDMGVETRTVDAHALRLRKKLRAAGLDGWLRATRGVGYRLLP